MEQTFTPPTICLIDDDKIYQFLVTRIIEMLNPQQKVIAFNNGKEAVDFFKYQQKDSSAIPDVIFLDINMPVMDGWEFLEAYNTIKHSLVKPVTIYMVSSSFDERDKLRSKTFAVVKDFLVKPLNQQRISEILAQPTAQA